MKDSKNDKDLYLESWDETGYLESFKLLEVTSVYNDSVFGGISWSKDRRSIVFISEKPETFAYNPFWSTSSESGL